MTAKSLFSEAVLHPIVFVDQIPADEQVLILKAVEALSSAYAPYSGFDVGAAALLDNGVMVPGSNQENIAYPSGMCAERVALFATGAQYPGVRIKALAICCRPNGEEEQLISPCGACRQVMYESEARQGSDIKLYVFVAGGQIYRADNLHSLLPFPFSFPARQPKT
ncbi:MAG: cytidine deaminase [Bacteroidota bacterium]|nr:cytidine deaminase [Bacteroidota bacterium]